MVFVFFTGRNRAGPLGLPSTIRAPAASRPSSTRAANHQPHDGLPDPPPDRSRGKRRRSHCRPADPPQLATLRSHEGSQLHSNLVQGHFLTRRKRLPVQHSSLCHLHDAMAVHPNKIAKVRRAKRCCGIGDEGVTSLVQSWVHQHLPTLPTLHTAVPPWKAGAAEPMPSRLVSYTMVLKRAPSAPGFEQLPIPSCPASPAVQRSWRPYLRSLATVVLPDRQKKEVHLLLMLIVVGPSVPGCSTGELEPSKNSAQRWHSLVQPRHLDQRREQFRFTGCRDDKGCLISTACIQYVYATKSWPSLASLSTCPLNSRNAAAWRMIASVAAGMSIPGTLRSTRTRSPLAVHQITAGIISVEKGHPFLDPERKAMNAILVQLQLEPKW